MPSARLSLPRVANAPAGRACWNAVMFVCVISISEGLAGSHVDFFHGSKITAGGQRAVFLNVIFYCRRVSTTVNQFKLFILNDKSHERFGVWQRSTVPNGCICGTVLCSDRFHTCTVHELLQPSCNAFLNFP